MSLRVHPTGRGDFTHLNESGATISVRRNGAVSQKTSYAARGKVIDLVSDATNTVV